MTNWTQLEAERAFAAATRGRRRAALLGRLRRRGCTTDSLAVYDETRRVGGAPARGVHDISLNEIKGTTEPNRAAQFDVAFRPTAITRCRWLRVWDAVHRGVSLPPISVVRVGDAYAIRDGHHRVSVAKALGALSIRAVVAA